MSDRNPGPIPSRWLKCPRKATGLFADQFLAFKTPLDSRYNDKVQDIYRFTPTMLFDSVKSFKRKLGLWIDLTNTSRFYDKSEIERRDCKYVKMQCRGHGETPSAQQTQQFIQIVSSFMNQKPNEIIGVHCTHGFNRTGFLIVSYMVEQLDFSVEAALLEFAKKRAPGIYKQDYIEELYRRYDDVKDMISAPERPEWCNEEEVDYDDDDAPSNSQSASVQSSNGHSRKKRRIKNKEFMAGVSGVSLFEVEPRATEVQKKAKEFCKWTGKEFPGAQPVSMDMQNISYLHDKPYRVSWKADGVRYMMLIDGKDEVYMIDRDNCVFKVHNLQFLHNKDDRHLKNTLLDGELVIDKVDGVEKPRYLCYDIIRFDNINVGKEPFHPVRLHCIENEIIKPRHRAITEGRIAKEREPFGVILKGFWDVTMAGQLLDDKFARTLHHEPDGLIFQPSKEPYVPGPCADVLKWKPSNMNSVDFKLKITIDTRPGMLPKKIGCLYTGGDTFFATMRVTKAIRELNNKIIECKVENNEWVFMRERTDKSFPNSYNTAKSVFESIKNPVTQEFLLDYIDKHRFMDDSDRMPPPAKRVRSR
ncbi:mRNA-capping enzyme isoform X2 [Maniola hyperantus]|uniref:mRNA-capping enzyme isoform X2 n=1 Tax=Aphantopus hyperantus TaxID=2795564 RepID=UPI00156989BD|nr:mRNA-capping enzyme isoform X2 [Maniola hyperantus]